MTGQLTGCVTGKSAPLDPGGLVVKLALSFKLWLHAWGGGTSIRGGMGAIFMCCLSVWLAVSYFRYLIVTEKLNLSLTMGFQMSGWLLLSWA